MAKANTTGQQPEPRTGVLYENRDTGEYRAAVGPATFTTGDPAWHRLGPVDVVVSAGRPDEQEAGRTYAEIREMPPAITEDQRLKIEATHQSDPHAFARRAALAVLAQPCAGIFEKIQDDRGTAVAFASVLHHVDDLMAHITAYRDMIEAAQTRLMVGLCAREDMTEVLAEATATFH